MEHHLISTNDAVVVNTKQGKLRGFYYDRVFNFWGVRYARAKRFQMPVEPECWEGVKTAMAYGYAVHCGALCPAGPVYGAADSRPAGRQHAPAAKAGVGRRINSLYDIVKLNE